MHNAQNAVFAGVSASLEESSNTIRLTIVKAPERNLWSSLFATDRSDFRRYSDFDGSYENTCRHAYTYPDIGFLGKIVAKMVRAKVLEIVKFVQILQA